MFILLCISGRITNTQQVTSSHPVSVFYISEFYYLRASPACALG